MTSANSPLQYECTECGMAVKGLACAKCGKPLIHKTIHKDDKKVHVSECPTGCGKIKSPTCCGHDMHATS